VTFFSARSLISVLAVYLFLPMGDYSTIHSSLYAGSPIHSHEIVGAKKSPERMKELEKQFSK